MAFYSDRYKQSKLTTKTVLRATLTPSKPKQIQSARSLNTVIAQEAGIFYNTEITKLWELASMTKFSHTH